MAITTMRARYNKHGRLPVADYCTSSTGSSDGGGGVRRIRVRVRVRGWVRQGQRQALLGDYHTIRYGYVSGR